MRIVHFLILISLVLSAPLVGRSHASPNVHEIMEELFTYHIDHKEISPILLTRSLKLYITNFDDNYAYLSMQDVHAYVEPTSFLVRQLEKGYQEDNYQTFFDINQMIVGSIERSRAWRAQWKKEWPELIKISQEKKEEELTKKNRAFASTTEEVKQRHYDFFVQLIAIHMKKLKEESYKGREERVVALVEKQLRLIEDGYLGINERGVALGAEEREAEILVRVVKALAASLDAHTAYYSPEEAIAMRTQLAKGMCGIGVVLQEGLDGVMIVEFVKGGPADSTGKLQVGDTIVKVGDVDVRDYSFPYILELMRGKEGTSLSLEVSRGEQLVSVQLERSQITLDDKRVDVSSEPYGDGIIGKITLYSFYEGNDGVTSESDVKKAIQELRQQGKLYGLVLDLRENGGGFLTQAVKVSGLFIKSGVVVISKYSGDHLKYYRNFARSKFYDGPLVVLISRGSASAAEILAQTLQDYGVAIVVGDEQSYGKGTIQHQTITDERAKAFFKVTIGRYYTVSGRSTQIDGVKSDIVVPTKLQFEEMGEGFSEYPLVADRVPSAYGEESKSKSQNTSNMQARSEKWVETVDLLKKNSSGRLLGNENFQAFLSSVKGEACEAYGCSDLQMAECVNIVKDMIFLDYPRS